MKKSGNQARLAARLGISQPMVSRHAATGMPTDSVAAARKWRRDNLDPDKVRRTEPLPLAEAKRRRAQADAELKEIELRVRRGELVPRADVIRSGTNCGAALGAGLEALLGRMAGLLDGAALAALRTEVYTLRTDFGRLISEAADRAGKKP